MNTLDAAFLRSIESVGARVIQSYADLGYKFLPTGDVSVDLAFGGGLPLGQVTEVWGKKSYGKTTLSYIAAASAIRRGGRVAFIDAEGSMNPEWAARFGAEAGDVNSMIVIRPTSGGGSAALNAVEMVVKNSKKMDISLIIIDSLAVLYPKYEAEKDVMDAPRMASRASLLTTFFARLPGIMEDYGKDVAILALNQVRDTMQQHGEQEYPPGGRAKDHVMVIQAKMLAPEIIGSKKDIQGRRHIGRTNKNKAAVSDQEFGFTVMYKPYPFHMSAGSTFDVAKQLGILHKQDGDVYTGMGKPCFDDEVLGSSQNDAILSIHNDPDLEEEIVGRIHERIQHGTAEPGTGDQTPDLL